MRFTGEYELHFGEVLEATEQNAKVFDKSFYDYFANLFSGTFNWTDILPLLWSDFAYGATDPYDDPILTYNPAAALGITAYYGKQTLWNW